MQLFDRADPTWSGNRSSCGKYSFLTNPLHTQGVLISDVKDIAKAHVACIGLVVLTLIRVGLRIVWDKLLLPQILQDPLAIYGWKLCGSYCCYCR